MPRQLSEAEFNEIRDAVMQAAPPGLSEAEFNRLIVPQFEGAIARAENLPAPLTGSALRRFLGGAGRMLNPVTMAQGLYQTVRHPIDTATGLVEASADQARKAKSAFDEGRYIEAAGHGLAVTPLIGPPAAHIAERMVETGDVATGLGETAGLVAPFAASAAIRGRVAQRARRGDPARLEREAAEQVSQRVLAPGNVRFKGKAEAVAPEVLKRGLKGGREELAQAAEEGMEAAGRQIDDAIAAAGGRQAGVIIDPIVESLRRKVDSLTFENGEPFKGAEARVAGLKARIDQLERAARVAPQPQGLVPAGAPTPKPLRALSADDLLRFRDEQYRIANEARAYERMGNPAMNAEGFASREAGSAVRQEFARLSPDMAAANADYTFFKTLGDILDPAQGRPKVTAPSAGITGGAATSGAVAGAMVGPKAAFVLSVVRPWIQQVRSTPAWQLADAQSKMRLAAAIRAGDVPTAQRLMARISEGGVMVGAGRPTSPTESPAPTR